MYSWTRPGFTDYTYVTGKSTILQVTETNPFPVSCPVLDDETSPLECQNVRDHHCHYLLYRVRIPARTSKTYVPHGTVSTQLLHLP